MRGIAAAFALLAACTTAAAMEFRAIGSTLVMSGPVTGHDLARLKDHLAPGKVKLVLLHASSGGDLWNGLQMGERIREEGLPTAVAGRCASSCALVFLGGTGRSASDGTALKGTRLGLHGPHSRSTKAVSLKNAARLAHYIDRMTGGKYPPALLERTVYIAHAQDIVYVYHPAVQGNPAASGVVACLHAGGHARSCEPVEGVDALSIGVLTQHAVLALDPEVKALLQPVPE